MRMKDSGIDWIGEIPQEWKCIRAKNIFVQSLEKGNTVLELLSATQNNGVVPKAALEGVVQVSENADLTTFKTVHKGDYVISLRSFQGGFEMSNYEGVITPAYTVFRAKTPINNQYFKMLFKCDGFISKMNSLTVGIREGKNIMFNDFANTYIPLPSLDEQQRIAEFLEHKCTKIDATIEKEQQIIEKLKEYKRSNITEAVTKGVNPDVPMKDSGIDWIGDIPAHWNIGKIKYATTKIGSGKTPKGGSEIYSQEGILFLRSQNIYDTGLVLEEVVYISDDIDEEMKNTRVFSDDVLLNITGGSIGRCCIYPEDLNSHANVNQHVCIIRTIHDIIIPKYMHYFWLSNAGKTSIDIYQTGANREGLNFQQIANTKIPYPPLDEQIQITKYLDYICIKIDSTIEKKQRLIEKLADYKKSLIYEAVTGKLKI